MKLVMIKAPQLMSKVILQWNYNHCAYYNKVCLLNINQISRLIEKLIIEEIDYTFCIASNKLPECSK